MIFATNSKILREVFTVVTRVPVIKFMVQNLVESAISW